jgi:hypothetical protein
MLLKFVETSYSSAGSESNSFSLVRHFASHKLEETE